jgi:hypothetical protein
MNLHSYPKVYAIGHAAVQELFNGPVLVEEKVDGSQFSFGAVSSEGEVLRLQMRSHGAEVFVDGTEKMFNHAVASCVEMLGELHAGWTYRVEYLQKPKHNNLCYGRVPAKHMILFDINTGDEIYLSRAEKEAEAARLGLEIVPVLFEGTIADPQTLLSLLDRESCLGGAKIEGIVVKNYIQFGRDKKVLMGKFVSEAYKETASKSWSAANPTLGDVIEMIIATLRSEARWEKALQKLRDLGQLKGEPADIGPLIKAAQADIKAEETEFIQAKLYEFALPRILRASTSGLPEWYKRKLLEGQKFGE